MSPNQVSSETDAAIPHRSISAANERTSLLATSSAYPVGGTEEEPALFARVLTGGKDVDSPQHHVARSSCTAQNASGADEDEEDDRPLPKLQILLLCYARLVEPIAFFSIFPFVNKMIEETGGVSKQDVGFYSGLIESLFSLTQMLLMIPWGRAADRLGRKPVLLFSLVGCSIASALFGFSKSVWQMIVFRCLAGMFAGTIVTVRAMITENSTKKTQARAFSFFAFSGNIGIFVGPFIGGGLSEPAKQYPNVFGNIQLFKDYPYSLPTLITGFFGCTGVILSALFVKETLVTKKYSSGDTGYAPAKPMPTLDLLKSPGVSMVLFLYGYVMFLGLAYTALIPVFWYTPPALGGFGFSPLQISVWLGVAGFSQAIWLLFIFPPLHNRFQTAGILRACTAAWPISFLFCPVFNLLRRNGANTIFWSILPFVQVAGSGISMSFTAVQLALNDVSPSPVVLGTLNALALTLTSAVRAVTPGAVTPLFAIGVGRRILGGNIIWVIMFIWAAGLTVSCWRWFPKEAEGGKSGYQRVNSGEREAQGRDECNASE